MPKVTAAERNAIVVGECNYWLGLIQTYCKDSNLTEAEKYRFAIDGAKIAVRELGNSKLEKMISPISNQAFSLIEDAKARVLR